MPLVPTGFGSTDAGKIACKAGPVAAKQINVVAYFLAELSLAISEQTYGEVCTPSDSFWETNYQEGRQNAIYDNVITNHGNIITTFQATQQLKIMLGEISDGVKEANENEQRRRLLEIVCTDREGKVPAGCTCVDTSLEAGGFSEPGCEKPSCQDFTLLCDGIGNNYPYIAQLRQG